MENTDVMTIGSQSAMRNNLQFATEQNVSMNHRGILDKMMNPRDCLTHLKHRADHFQDFKISDANDLKLRYQKPSDNEGKGYFYIEPNPNAFPQDHHLNKWFNQYKRMKVSPVGFKTACKQIKRKEKVLEAFEEPNNRFLDEFHDWFRFRAQKGLLIRTTNSAPKPKDRVVDAFLDPSFDTSSNYRLVYFIYEMIEKMYGNCIRGVQVIENIEGTGINFRIVFGSPVIVEETKDPNKLSLVMLSFDSDEFGLKPTTLSLGLWRLVCANGMMRTDLEFMNVKWDRMGGFDNFIEELKRLVKVAGPLGINLADKLNALRAMPLELAPQTIVHSLLDQKVVNSTMAETMLKSADLGNAESCWDLLNVMTDSAKAFSATSRRQKAESEAVMIAMHPGSFNRVATRGLDKTIARMDL